MTRGVLPGGGAPGSLSAAPDEPEAALPIDHLACPAFLVRENRLVRANAAARDLVDGDAPGTWMRDEALLASLRDVVVRSLAAPTEWVEGALPRPIGGPLDIEARAALFPGDDELIILVAHDATPRKRTESVLRQSEERYRALYEDNPSMLFTVDDGGRVLSVNRFGAEQLGYRPGDLVGKPVLDVFHEEDRAATRRHLETCIQNPGQVASWTGRKIHRDGRTIWVREDARCVRDGDRTIVLIVCEDITAKQLIEAELREARDALEERVAARTRDLTDKHARLLEEIERRMGAEAELGRERDLLHILLDHLGEHIYFKDLAGRYTRISRSMAHFYGLEDPMIAIGKSDFDFYPPEDAEGYRRDEVDLLSSGQRLTKVEACLRRTDSQLRFFLTTKAPVRDAHGAITGVFGISRDVTESRLAEQRLRTLVESTPEAIVIVDAGGTIVLESSRTHRLFRFDQHELTHTPFERLFAPSDRQRLRNLQRAFQDPARQAAVMSEPFYGHRKDGTHFPLEVSLSPIETEEGGFLAASLRDITERRNVEKRINDSVEREQRRIGQEVHDTLGQLITGVLMLAASVHRKLAARAAPEADAVAALVRNIEEAQTHIRDISRGLVPVEVDANGLMAALLGLMEWTQSTHGIVCAFECSSPVLIEDAFTATHLYRIAQEAVRNAVKHAEATSIVVTLDDSEGALRLTVADDGKGLASAPESGGVGLQIMRYRSGLVGGTLEIDSQPGRGTTLVCTLPGSRT